MKLFKNNSDKADSLFFKTLKKSRLSPLFDAVVHFIFTSGFVTRGAPHIRDALDMKRMMITVVIALMPAVIMAFYNTGLQINLALQSLDREFAVGWRGELLSACVIGINADSIVDNMAHGALYFLPVYFITLVAGGFWEVLFACARRQAISEGFLVTSLLFALTLPPDIPWWQVVLGISFGVVIGKEIFGGVGMNILNPALVGRCFLYFSYPAQMTGNSVWVPVDGYARATPLAAWSDPELDFSVTWQDAFLGFIPGSMGETSTLACLLGAAILIISRVGPWRVMFGVLSGMIVVAVLFNQVGSATNAMFQVTPVWHLVLGGFAFGAVFMATDPVTSAHTLPGQYVYGLLIGALTVLVRVVNPGFPEGIMLAILFGNVFAPAIDRIFVNRNIKRRLLRIRNDAKR